MASEMGNLKYGTQSEMDNLKYGTQSQMGNLKNGTRSQMVYLTNGTNEMNTISVMKGMSNTRLTSYPSPSPRNETENYAHAYLCLPGVLHKKSNTQVNRTERTEACTDPHSSMIVCDTQVVRRGFFCSHKRIGSFWTMLSSEKQILIDKIQIRARLAVMEQERVRRAAKAEHRHARRAKKEPTLKSEPFLQPECPYKLFLTP